MAYFPKNRPGGDKAQRLTRQSGGRTPTPKGDVEPLNPADYETFRDLGSAAYRRATNFDERVKHLPPGLGGPGKLPNPPSEKKRGGGVRGRGLK